MADATILPGSRDRYPARCYRGAEATGLSGPAAPI
jgi:hypothetical protein